MVFSNSKEFVFPGWQCCATQVAYDTVGSSLMEASSWRSVSGVSSDAKKKIIIIKMFSYCSDLGLIVKQRMCQD